MGDQKSLTSALAGVLVVLIKRDLAQARLWHSDEYMERDATYVVQRASAEGISFLTKSLPSLGKALDRALSSDTPFEAPQGFKTLRNSKLPRFLGSLFRCVFNERGELLPATSAEHLIYRDIGKCQAQATAVAGIRQIAYMFYKLNLPYTDHETRRVLDQFCDVEQELASQGDPDLDNDRVLRCSRRLISSVCCNIDPRQIIPRHGPGSVATGENARQKTRFKRIYESVEAFYPFTEYFRFGLTHVADTYHDFDKLEVLPAPMAKVVLVPKDSRGPRIISMEPLEVQWLQQGLRTLLYSAVESHPLTKGRVSFTDQTINRELARKNSHSGELATIDMKDASDRVSLKLVTALFGQTALLDGMLATRSHSTLLPDGRVIPLHKFAPMGSALCFPVEALVFWAIAVSVLHIVVGMPLREAVRHVYVYGDDILCPNRHWTTIAAAYRACNLEVNLSKCCTRANGVFRESCGLDAMWGHDVTPIRIKRHMGHPLSEWVPAYVEQSNLLYDRGYTATADVLEKIVRSYIKDIPLVDRSSTLPIAFKRDYASPSVNPAKVRYNRKLQRYEIKGYVIRSTQQAPLYGGYEMMLRHWAELIQSSEDRSEKIEYSVRHTAKLRKTWLPM